jgi:hypothetical protein
LRLLLLCGISIQCLQVLHLHREALSLFHTSEVQVEGNQVGDPNHLSALVLGYRSQLVLLLGHLFRKQA